MSSARCCATSTACGGSSSRPTKTPPRRPTSSSPTSSPSPPTAWSMRSTSSASTATTTSSPGSRWSPPSTATTSAKAAATVTPDLLPICAPSVGLVAGRRDLARRAFVTLTLGLGLVVATAAVLSLLLKWTGFLPDGFEVEHSSLNNLAHTDYSTVLIALAAGVAAMLSFETKASAAVGVAISVTTIPASAYLGVAIGGGGVDEASGAVAVLAANVALLIATGR